uniref:Uncharacterized protein n=1 Tax=Timema cristinae TaxID=61476 RepID=A0A7R9CG95_TIMCR|nr:unnamed protein product [Timema cristinae]
MHQFCICTLLILFRSRTSFVVGMSSGFSSIPSSSSSSLDSGCSPIILASSSSSAAMYSSYVQSGANLCHVSLSYGRVKVRGADQGAVDGLGCGSMEGPTCGSVEAPGWKLASTGGGSSGSSTLAVAGSTQMLASSLTGRTKWACQKQLEITAGRTALQLAAIPSMALNTGSRAWGNIVSFVGGGGQSQVLLAGIDEVVSIFIPDPPQLLVKPITNEDRIRLYHNLVNRQENLGGY